MQFDGQALAIDNDDYVESSDIFSHFFTKHFVLDKKKSISRLICTVRIFWCVEMIDIAEGNTYFLE